MPTRRPQQHLLPEPLRLPPPPPRPLPRTWTTATSSTQYLRRCFASCSQTLAVALHGRDKLQCRHPAPATQPRTQGTNDRSARRTPRLTCRQPTVPPPLPQQHTPGGDSARRTRRTNASGSSATPRPVSARLEHRQRPNHLPRHSRRTYRAGMKRWSCSLTRRTGQLRSSTRS